MSTQPLISVEKARTGLFKQYNHKYKMITNMISQLPGGKGLGEGEMVKVAVLLFGPESSIY